MQSNNGPWKIQWMLSVICYEMINTHRISCFKRNLHLVQLTWIARCLFILCDDNIGANTGSIRLPMATNYSNVGQHCSHVWPQSLKHHGKQTLGNDVDLTTSWLSSQWNKFISLVRPMFSLQGRKRPWKRACQLTSPHLLYNSFFNFPNTRDK